MKILDAPFALMAAYRDTKKQMNVLSFLKRKLLVSVRGTLAITQFHCIYLCENCIKHGILKNRKKFMENFRMFFMKKEKKTI
ncbi:hypothetical protein ABE007_17675 [Bacillus altitudinis]|uniref:Uncharacterized protein n=1 Tax=Bacillus aerius TaxID=293388 RepID=A0AB39J5B5_9BACI|nr:MULTISPECIES: hypothetical protein [Bacillus]ANT56720.1 hypothetical protein VP59_07860 [Bacillus pumilus]KML12733.1 hypothetical protein VL09_17155 [Bacillus stratosphericus]KML64007.1 hypothetical protein VL19_00060 [Bacillus stratosphericus]KMN34450.1 hypothetical protein ABW26_00490 [Bacillus stratosphericus]MBR0630205.1 hypothetical protein [Bacillus altitudinis C101]